MFIVIVLLSFCVFYKYGSLVAELVLIRGLERELKKGNTSNSDLWYLTKAAANKFVAILALLIVIIFGINGVV